MAYTNAAAGPSEVRLLRGELARAIIAEAKKRDESPELQCLG